ncbi:hypothetical protein NAEGRDRAFT_79171 [Naegleria gruberi]|uniref:RGS domain-containing protein n=1 Tax=Naegleria gruberi TaxID=5762 RepID=D2VA40_NAEGR|nr:uncharacterized protein NAEGRDRAFT_79171 [Naegleria gruberi]EFC46361.1 hypothetical protein NAEGRDRAFT_79171 [Naegleria gruberi]|eukprot:XP_002679105.1 hypothetical protein NAEGRDRAFT_79171 [Naegleria gruberi strain NEG-M]
MTSTASSASSVNGINHQQVLSLKMNQIQQQQGGEANISHHTGKKVTKEERSIFKHYSFDMESCLSASTMEANDSSSVYAQQTILSLFKHFLESDSDGRYIPLLSLYLQMKHNPSYYDNLLYAEKKWEIECFLKHDAFPRFIRTDAFKLHIINRLRSIKKSNSYLTSPRNTESSTTLSIHSDHFNNLILGRAAAHSPANSYSATQSSIDDSTFIGSTDSNAILDIKLSDESSLSSRHTDTEYSTLKDTSKLDGEREGNSFAITNHNSDEDDEEESADTNSTATSTSGVSFNHHHHFENRSHRRKSKDNIFLLSNRNVSEFLNMLAIPVRSERESLFKSLAEMKSSLFLSEEHMNYMNSLMADSPDWDIVYTIPSNMEAINSNKCIPNHVHKDYLSRNGGTFTFSMISKNVNRKIHHDLPLDKTSIWKYHSYLPFTHHEVFQMLEKNHFIISKKKKSKDNQLGTDLLDPHFNVHGGNRQFYCYDEILNVPSSSGSSLFSRFSGSNGKELNMLATNFYDSQRSEYVVCVKSEGYDNSSMDVIDNTWGLKIMKITKITNTLTKLSECGCMYFGDANTRDFFLSNLVNTSQKDKKTFMYNALILGCLEIKMEISQTSNSKLSQQSISKTISPIRAKCLTMNGQIMKNKAD